MEENPTLLIIDDEPVNLSVLSQILSKTYTVRAANSGVRALQVANSFPQPDLILLDILMPNMDGYLVLKKLQDNKDTAEIPVIFVTALDQSVDEEKGLNLGAVDYISKPIKSSILLARVKTQLILKQARTFLRNKSDFLEEEVNRRMQENLTVQNATIRALAHLAETRDPETGSHILRTQSYVEALAKKLKNKGLFKETICDEYISLVTRSAPLHDIGKVGIPDNVLLKPGPLNAKEWHIMKTHSELGANAIELTEKDLNQSIDFLNLAKEIAHFHHEKWDGSGYPKGLSGEGIPISARLMAIADVFDALTTERVYKNAMSCDEAKTIIIEGKGKHFDPVMVDAFIECFEEFESISKSYSH